jgi:hypothetical protein
LALLSLCPGREDIDRNTTQIEKRAQSDIKVVYFHIRLTGKRAKARKRKTIQKE